VDVYRVAHDLPDERAVYAGDDLDFADGSGDYEAQPLGSGLLVELHRGEHLLGIEPWGMGGKPGRAQDPADPGGVLRRQKPQLNGELAGAHHTDGDGLSVAQPAQPAGGLEAVAEGVAVVEDPPKPGLPLVGTDHSRLDTA